MDEVSIEQARPKLGDLVRDAQQHGITTFITRNGKPAAVLVPVDWYEDAEAAWSAQVEKDAGSMT